MKRFGWILLLAAAASTLLSADTKKISVAQFQDLLTGLHNSHKTDEEVANEMKQIELTEELTSATMNSMASLVNGPLSTEQMYVLEARSAMLAPPDTDLPKTTPPDTTAQQAMLAKAQDYTAKTYPQLPRLIATRLVARFQDGVESIQSFSGANVHTINDNDPIMQQARQSIHLANTHTDTIEIDNGIEKPGGKDTTPWGRNNLVNSMLPFLPLNLLTTEAVSSGSLKFLRWETLSGREAAVFTFSVDKKKSHYAISYCCFPDTSSIGGVLYGATPGTGGGSGGLSASPAAHPANNGSLANVSDWKNFNSKSGYHGELFIDPASGFILRTIVEAEFKPSDFVHFEDIRIDYAPMPIGGKSLFVPVRTFTIADVVPNGDSFAAHYAVRHDLVTQDYKDYHLVGSSAASNAPEVDAKPHLNNGANKLVQQVNADVIAARAATREKRYADAEAIMLKDTASNPGLIPPWVELGLAQLGQKKYTEAEASFKTALAINPSSPKSQQNNGFQSADNPNSTQIGRTVTAASAIASEQTRPPDVVGIIDSSLGEVYIRTNRVPEAEAAFDAAAQTYPPEAAFYLSNETIFFFQAGNTDAQLKAAEKAIAADPTRANMYYFKGQALVSKATMDSATQKMVLPPDCADAYKKYLQLDPNGAYSADAKAILASAGIQVAKK